MRDEITHLARTLNEVIGQAVARPRLGPPLTDEHGPQSGYDRSVALAKYHAEQLGIHIQEVEGWLASGTVKRRLSQSRPRGRERSPREIRQ